MQKQSQNRIISKNFHPYLDKIKKVDNPILVKTPKIHNLYGKIQRMDKEFPKTARADTSNEIASKLDRSNFNPDKTQTLNDLYYKGESKTQQVNQSQEILSFKEGNQIEEAEAKQGNNKEKITRAKKRSAHSSSRVSSANQSLEDNIQQQSKEDQSSKVKQQNKKDLQNVKQMQVILNIPENVKKSRQNRLKKQERFPQIQSKRSKYPNAFEIKGNLIKNLDDFPGVFKIPYPENFTELKQNQIQLHQSPILRQRVMVQQEQNSQMENTQRAIKKEKQIKLMKFNRPISPSSQIENKITLKIPTIPHYYTFYDAEREQKLKEVSKTQEILTTTTESNKLQFALKDQNSYQSKTKFSVKSKKHLAIGLFKPPEIHYPENQLAINIQTEPLIQPTEPKIPQLDFSKAQFYKMLSLCFQQFQSDNQTQYKVFKKAKYEKFNKQKQEIKAIDLNEVLDFQEDSQDLSF